MPVCHVFCLFTMHNPCHPVLHGFQGSAWAWSRACRLGVPLSDLRLLCGSIDGWVVGCEGRETTPKF